MTKPARDYPARMTPKAFAKLGERLHRGPWLRDLERRAAKHGTDVTWDQSNPWAVAAARTYNEDFPTDPDGPYADLLELSGLRAEDSEDDVGGSGEVDK